MNTYWSAFLDEIGTRVYSLSISFMLELFYYYLYDNKKYKDMIDNFDNRPRDIF